MPAMNTPPPLPLLVLLVGLATATHTPIASALQQACAAPAQHELAVQASQCEALPCSVAWDSLTLALPVLLSLKDPYLLTSNQPNTAWGMTLLVQDEAGASVGTADLSWAEQEDKHMYGVFLTAWSCDGFRQQRFVPRVTQEEDRWLHLGVAATGREVSFILVAGRKKITVMRLPLQDPGHLMPASVKVTRTASLYGYSALNTNTNTQTTTTTTTPATPAQAVLLAITTGVGISVVWSVVVLVVMCCKCCEMEALLAALATADLQ